MATGTGKTVVFSYIAKRFLDAGGRVLVLAHRQELLVQAAATIEDVTGYVVGWEKGDARVPRMIPPRIVMGSVQTLANGRYKEFNADTFDLIIVDEAHHAPAKSYAKVLDWFGIAKVVGCTATPDRLDKVKLGVQFDSVSYEYGVLQAITDGWLVPIRQRIVKVESMDFSDIPVRRGDFTKAQLDVLAAREGVCHGVAEPTVELAGDRRTIVFGINITHATTLTEVLNRIKPDSAVLVTGKTPQDERDQIIQEFRAGRWQFLVNVGIALEGFDVPEVSCIAMARPTKSRAVYSQAVGRGTRPSPGKTDLLVLDFCGNAGKHDLACVADILMDDIPQEVREVVKRAAEEEDVDVVETLDQASADYIEAEKRALVRAKVQFTTSELDVQTPKEVLNMLGVFGYRVKGYIRMSREDKERMCKYLPAEVVNLCCRDHGRMIRREAAKRYEAGLCSIKQMRCLRRAGYPDEQTRSMSFEEASGIIDSLSKDWRSKR